MGTVDVEESNNDDIHAIVCVVRLAQHSVSVNVRVGVGVSVVANNNLVCG
jgi:hypothetical protein